MKNKNKGNTVIEINYEFGSDFQKSVHMDVLISFIIQWQNYVKNAHKKNKIYVDIFNDKI